MNITMTKTRIEPSRRFHSGVWHPSIVVGRSADPDQKVLDAIRAGSGA